MAPKTNGKYIPLWLWQSQGGKVEPLQRPIQYGNMPLHTLVDAGYRIPNSTYTRDPLRYLPKR